VRVVKQNWVVRSRGSEGALTDAQVYRLATEFGLSEDCLRCLSKDIAHPLSPEFFVGDIVKVLKQQDKSSAEIDKLIKNIRQAEIRLIKATAQIRETSIQFPNVGQGIEDPNIWLTTELGMSTQNVQFIRRLLEKSTKKYSASYFGEPDKRSNRDHRQGSVLFAIFDAWKASGRKVTISTNAVTSERTGPLVDFADAVISCVTNPVIQLKGETVWQAIKRWQKLRKLEDKVDQFPKNS
jgi:hypothetical protein